MNRRSSILLSCAMGVLCHGVDAAELAPAVRGFLDRHCAECHDSDLLNAYHNETIININKMK